VNKINGFAAWVMRSGDPSNHAPYGLGYLMVKRLCLSGVNQTFLLWR
jgi:hypothetical protein